MLQRYKIFLNGCNITTFFNTIHSFFCRKITKNTLKTTFYLNVTKTKKVDSAWASNEKAADSHDGLSAADAKEEQLPGCVEHFADLSEEIVSDALSCDCPLALRRSVPSKCLWANALTAIRQSPLASRR